MCEEDTGINKKYDIKTSLPRKSLISVKHFLFFPRNPGLIKTAHMVSWKGRIEMKSDLREN
jgi:hypothetical protein